MAMLSITLSTYAGSREAFFYEIWRHPEILSEPIFWGVVVFGLLCLGLYLRTKEKGE